MLVMPVVPCDGRSHVVRADHVHDIPRAGMSREAEDDHIVELRICRGEAYTGAYTHTHVYTHTYVVVVGGGGGDG